VQGPDEASTRANWELMRACLQGAARPDWPYTWRATYWPYTSRATYWPYTWRATYWPYTRRATARRRPAHGCTPRPALATPTRPHAPPDLTPAAQPAQPAFLYGPALTSQASPPAPLIFSPHLAGGEWEPAIQAMKLLCYTYAELDRYGPHVEALLTAPAHVNTLVLLLADRTEQAGPGAACRRAAG
jgi:hypothetical protein